METETGKGSNGENRERRTELAVIPSGAPSGGGEESQSSRYRACLWPTAARVTSQSSDASGQSESAVCRHGVPFGAETGNARLAPERCDWERAAQN